MKKIPHNFSEPSRQQINNLLKYYQTGRYIDAEKLSLFITKEFPNHRFAWKVLAAVLKQTGRINESLIVSKKSVQLDPHDSEAHYNLGVLQQEQDKLKEAEESFRRAIKLNPNFAEANYNLGIILKKLGRLEEAEESYRHTIKLNPNFAQAYNNLGVVIKELGRLEEAEEYYREAIKLKSNYVEAHSNLGVIMKELGRLEEACFAFIQVINLNPDFTDAYANFAYVIKNVRFTSSNIKIYPLLNQLINTKNYARPLDLAPSILSLLKLDPQIKNLLLEENFAKNFKEVNFIINKLDKLMLLHSLMRVSRIPDLQFEKFFVNMRSLILENLNNFEATPNFIYFLSTLSLHCFANEHVFFEKNKETELVKNLENEITQIISKSKQPDVIKILCLATYRPLHQYKWSQKLKTLDNLQDVKSRLIEEPYNERAIMEEIPILGEISNSVSNKVRRQYEKNPYPRWIKIGMPTRAKSISEISDEENLYLYNKNIKNVIAPDILIAGCGTGQHSIGTVSRFSDCKVTAVDLSLASLAYAKRMTVKHRVTNIEYLQADILGLSKLKQKFDIIESVGVLHHMDEPMAGWRTLTDLLKPSGLMKIGLYSDLARQHIAKIRQEITLLKVGTSETDIKKFRQSLIESQDKNHKLLASSNDFFSLSTLRDLIFHVQEHRFTLLQIKNCLNKLGLKFCGFQNKDIVSNFRKYHYKEEDIYNLALWHQYEKNNPRTFSGMYQFWCQKI